MNSSSAEPASRFQIIDSVDQLPPGKYYDALKRIAQQKPRTSLRDEVRHQLVYPLHDVIHASNAKDFAPPTGPVQVDDKTERYREDLQAIAYSNPPRQRDLEVRHEFGYDLSKRFPSSKDPSAVPEDTASTSDNANMHTVSGDEAIDTSAMLKENADPSPHLSPIDPDLEALAIESDDEMEEAETEDELEGFGDEEVLANIVLDDESDWEDEDEDEDVDLADESD